jgi:quercetin dioxygenase-like cupin family protein
MTLGTALLTVIALALSASAQTTPTAPAITRTIVAAIKLPSVVETPLHFKAMRVTLQPGGKSSLSAANGILYQLSGSTEISLGGENKVLSVGEGLFVAAGKTASLGAGSGAPSILLYFLLAPAAELDRSTAIAPATVTELYRTVAPIPDLKPGGYDLRDAVQPAAPSLGSSALLHRLGNGRQHSRRHDEDKGP